jgi:hypothetical protein
MATAGMCCRKCGYDLQGQVGGAERRCPECGWRFDANDKQTFRTKPLRSAWRRWTQRVVILLLALTTVLGATWGWLYWGWKSEQRAVASAGAEVLGRKPLGGETLKGHLGSVGWVLDRVTGIRLPMSATDADLVPLKELKGLQDLRLYWTQVTDAGLSHLKDIKDLRELELGTKVTNDGLVHLADIKGLQTLGLADTSVTDAGLAHLKELKGLNTLWLNGAKISNAGLEHLKDLMRLQTLGLEDTKVTDDGLEHLKYLKRLQRLDLRRTRVTAAGVKELQAALPGTKIEWP